MPNYHICQNTRISLERIRLLKQAFDVSFEKALVSGDLIDRKEAQQNKQMLEEQMAQLHAQICAWEKRAIETHQEKLLQSLSEKKETGIPLNKYELFVLYEIYTPVPLSEDLLTWRNKRPHEEDLFTMFDYLPGQIAHSLEEMTPETQMYIGKLEKDFFQRLPETCEFIYTSFPEQRIRRQDIKIGGKDEYEIEDLLERHGHRFNFNDVKWVMEHDDFKRSLREIDPNEPDYTKWKLKSPEEITLIRLRVADLGFPHGVTVDQIYARAEELGLELCPPEVGPRLCIQHQNQPVFENLYVENLYVGMKPISDSGGQGDIFVLGTNTSLNGVPELSNGWAAPKIMFYTNREMVFRLRKKPLKPN